MRYKSLLRSSHGQRLAAALFLLTAVLGTNAATNLTAQTEPPLSQRRTNSLGQIFTTIPGTSLEFCIWDTRVKDYKAFVSATHRDWTKPDFEQTPTHPAVNVTWQDAHDFCAWLTAKEHKKHLLKDSQSYRLPTDAEWSHAAGLDSEPGDSPAEKNKKVRGMYPWGKGWPPPKASGNFADATLKRKDSKYYVIPDYDDGYADTSPVGTFTDNLNGLFDMGGNVWQWCEDSYDRNQQGRVLRGGSCVSVPGFLLLSNRNNFSPTNSYSYIGFRCVLANTAATP
jgi:formylglycine-generating enzyme required for sulfatase activity